MHESEPKAVEASWWSHFALGVGVGMFVLISVGIVYVLYVEHFHVLHGDFGGPVSSVSDAPGP